MDAIWMVVLVVAGIGSIIVYAMSISTTNKIEEHYKDNNEK